MSEDVNESVSRRRALTWISLVPLALSAAPSIADAADNKKQFHYQDKPGPGGKKCSGCRLFRAPSGCSLVTGTISPNGWCIAWAKR